jgi:hypothetical protein
MSAFVNQEDPKERVKINQALTTILSLHDKTAKVRQLGAIVKDYHQKCSDIESVPVPVAELRAATGPLKAQEVRAAHRELKAKRTQQARDKALDDCITALSKLSQRKDDQKG